MIETPLFHCLTFTLVFVDDPVTLEALAVVGALLIHTLMLTPMLTLTLIVVCNIIYTEL